MTNDKNLQVLPIAPEQTYDWLRRVHYAGRIPSISYAFGLYDGAELVGIITYGTPSSAPLREGIAGKENARHVLELNRLCFAAPMKNGASMLVSQSMKMLPKPSIVVSYADIGQGHVGYVYQACNFIYTGLSAKRTDWKIDGMDGLHGQTIADMSRQAAGGERGSRAAFMREKFGDKFKVEDRARKHRYIFVTGRKFDRQRLISALRYPAEAYPKGESKRYEITHTPAMQPLLWIPE